MTAVAALVVCGVFISPPGAKAAGLAAAVRGRILLDVASHGEAWYVLPDTAERISLGTPDNAYRVMRDHGLGITDADLARIAPAINASTGPDLDGDGLSDAFEVAVGTNATDGDSDDDGVSDRDEIAASTLPNGAGQRSVDAALIKRLAGHILLQVEGRGEAWYVDPVDGRRRYLGRPSDALAIMRASALGITSADLALVPEAGESEMTVLNDVPFVAQAPLGDWSDPSQADGCEEASALMAMRWVDGKPIALADAEREIITLSYWERNLYGSFEDTSIDDTAERIFRGWYKYDGVDVRHGIGAGDIYRELAVGNLVVASVNGRMLGNPRFRSPGPLRHMILITGYDAVRGEFIVNEPGTTQGSSWRYPRQTLSDALQDYASGAHLPVPERRTAMIAVRPRAE